MFQFITLLGQQWLDCHVHFVREWYRLRVMPPHCEFFLARTLCTCVSVHVRVCMSACVNPGPAPYSKFFGDSFLVKAFCMVLFQSYVYHI